MTYGIPPPGLFSGQSILRNKKIYMIDAHLNVAMPFQSDNIAMIIDQMNYQYYLPAIQREFVWRQVKIIKLFDSIMRGYPISSFLLWTVKEPNYNNYEIYSFVENYDEGVTHLEKAPTDGFKQVTLVLDGQQRLTSFLIGLKGSYKIRKKHSKIKQKVKQRLYLDLLKDPSDVDDNDEDGIHYGFEFLEDDPIADGIHYWFRVGRILECDNPDQFQNFKYEEIENLPDDKTIGQRKTFQKNLDRLYQAVWKDAVISYYIEQDQDENRVLDIFIRANDGATKLSKSDLLLSMVTLKWEQYNAKDEIYGFVDFLNNDLEPHKNDFDKDFIMKACLVLSDLPVQYRISNFKKDNLGIIEKNWEAIKKATESGVRLINNFGIDRDTLTSSNALIPIIYYLYKNPKLNLLECTPSNVKNISLIRTWFTMALVNNVFSGHSDTVLNKTRDVLRDNIDQEEFPISSLNKELSKDQKNTYFDDTTIDNFLEITYGKQNAFLALSLLYDNNNWGASQFHQDHIFPKSLFTKDKMTSAGISPEQQERYLVLKDQIGNLELISHDHPKKLAKDFDIWISTRDESFKKMHLIPSDESIYGFDKFEKFVEEREALIRARLKQLFIPI
jgi:uncharacterized protein with ParB-like and HNH nuclease domain